jgi:hypothetical protein
MGTSWQAQTAVRVRTASGRLHVAKLTDDQAAEVRRRRLAGATLRRLAADFGVGVMTVHAIVTGKTRHSAGAGDPAQSRCVERCRAERDRQRTRRAECAAAYRRAARDYLRGHSLRSAAARHGVTYTKLGTYLARRGIPRRPVGPPSKFCHRKV